MKPSKSKKSSPKNDKSKDLSAEAFDRRAAELTELLKACRDLSDILTMIRKKRPSSSFSVMVWGN
jgi:hypothetical protein